MKALQGLEVGLCGFEGHGYDDSSQDQFQIDGLPRYLTAIVGSSLSWIEEQFREDIWELASKRLSERAGRNGKFRSHMGLNSPWYMLSTCSV